MSRIALHQACKTYHAPGGKVTKAVRDLTLLVEPGELLVLVGPSGSGKTTTLRLIAGLERLDSGEIEIDGRPSHALPPQERDVAFVFQTAALYPHLNARENLELGLRIRGLPRAEIEQRLTQAIEILQLESCLSRLPHELSGGEAQRVALGRALVRRPAIFLLDEPLAHLDDPARLALRRWIRLVHEQTQATMLYVTHDQREALAMATRIAVLREGSLQQLGTPGEIYENPANPFVASFIGSPAVNLITGNIGARGPHTWFEPGNGDGMVLAVPPGLVDASGLDADVTVSATLALRPEHFHLQKPAGADESWRVPGRLVSLSLAGPEAYATWIAWGQELVARVPADCQLRAGAALALWADLRRARFFRD